MARGKNKELAQIKATLAKVEMPLAITTAQHNMLCAIKGYLLTHVLPFGWTASYEDHAWGANVTTPSGYFEIKGKSSAFIPGVGMADVTVTTDFYPADFDDAVAKLKVWIVAVCTHNHEQGKLYDNFRDERRAVEAVNKSLATFNPATLVGST